LRGLGHGVALSKACLAASSAVNGLVLDVILRAAVSGRRAAAVEVAIGTDTRAAHASLTATTDIDLGDTGREGWRSLAGGQGGRGTQVPAAGSSTRELAETSVGIAVGSGGVTPSILRAAFAGRADLVTVLGTTVLRESGGRKRDNGDKDRAHLD
jgi:hypothetical protein